MIVRLSCQAITLALLAGCANHQQMQAERDAASVEQTCSAAQQDVRLAPLHAVMPPRPMSASLPQLSDANHLDAQQKAALAVWYEVFDSCYDQQQAHLARYAANGASSVYGKMRADMKILRAGLYQDQITIGQFNTAASRLGAEAEASYAAIDQRQQAANAAIAAQQSQNMAIMAPLMRVQPVQIQPYLLPTQQTIQTTCNRYGNNVQCISR